MRHLSERGKILIALNSNISMQKLLFVEKFRNIFIFLVPDEVTNDRKYFAGEYIEYLDRFLIVLPYEYEQQRVLWADFYLFLADSYEEIIDMENNKRCIHELWSHIQNAKGKQDGYFLDFGCGSGLSAEVIGHSGLIGYEPNEKLREKAKDRGMKVLSHEEFLKLPEENINAIFASYVFHMGISIEDIAEMRRILKPEGMVVANFL